MGIFSKDVILDEQAFDSASTRLDQLANDMEKLKTDIATMLDELKLGFKTPAGEKFFLACENALLEPMNKQKTVITHVSSNLRRARGSYQSVFDEYERLNNSINKL